MDMISTHRAFCCNSLLLKEKALMVLVILTLKAVLNFLFPDQVIATSSNISFAKSGNLS